MVLGVNPGSSSLPHTPSYLISHPNLITYPTVIPHPHLIPHLQVTRSGLYTWSFRGNFPCLLCALGSSKACKNMDRNIHEAEVNPDACHQEILHVELHSMLTCDQMMLCNVKSSRVIWEDLIQEITWECQAGWQWSSCWLMSARQLTLFLWTWCKRLCKRPISRLVGSLSSLN